MNLNMLETEREVYSGLDWIGDMGGLLDGLNAICVLFLGLVNYNLYSSYMVSQLFQSQTKEPKDTQE